MWPLPRPPNYHKLFGHTDGGVVRHPSFEDKVEITRNGITLMRMLGYDVPKVGLLAYSEVAREDDPETWDAKRIVEMGEAGEFRSCADCRSPWLRHDAGQTLGGHQGLLNIPAPVDIDLMIAPDITACNASTKAIYLNGGQAAGVLVGNQGAGADAQPFRQRKNPPQHHGGGAL